MGDVEETDVRSRWRASSERGRRFPPRAFTGPCWPSHGHLDNFINGSDYRAGRRPRREINQFPRLVIRFVPRNQVSRKERERSGKGEEEFFVSAHKLHGREEDGAPVRSADTEQEE